MRSCAEEVLLLWLLLLGLLRPLLLLRLDAVASLWQRRAVCCAPRGKLLQLLVEVDLAL